MAEEVNELHQNFEANLTLDGQPGVDQGGLNDDIICVQMLSDDDGEDSDRYNEYFNFETKISFDDPEGDYTALRDDIEISHKLPHWVQNKMYEKISGAARETVWKLLFDEELVQVTERLEKASELLYAYKLDACYYSPWAYNDWIVLVRDELLKREMFDFWKNEIVEKKLGPCWARDSDLFDDVDDREPENFYKYAGCEAKWVQINTPTKKLSVETPLNDYKFHASAQRKLMADIKDCNRQIYKETADMIWQLLFGEPVLTAENSTKAARLLKVFKCDAGCFDYIMFNNWIAKVKDELIKRKYIDFWENVIVKNKLGWYHIDIPNHWTAGEYENMLEFYKLNEDSTKQQGK